MKPENLKTERLRLELMAPEHASELLAFQERNRAHLEPWEPKRDDAYFTPAYQLAEIERAEESARNRSAFRFVAFEHNRAEVIATVNLWNIRRGVIQAAILGYAVDVSYQGRGLATEAAGAVIRYAFDVLKLHRLETGYQPTNERSARVLRKLGFAIEGYARDHLLIDGAWRDSILVSLTNAAWQPGERAET